MRWRRYLPSGVYDDVLLAVICCIGVGRSPLELDELAIKVCMGLNSSPGISSALQIVFTLRIHVTGAMTAQRI